MIFKLNISNLMLRKDYWIKISQKCAYLHHQT